MSLAFVTITVRYDFLPMFRRLRRKISIRISRPRLFVFICITNKKDWKTQNVC